MNITVIEEWRPVTYDEFLPFYEVSNLGNIRSLDRVSNGSLRRGKLLRQHIGSRDYLMLMLSAGGASKLFNVHRIVALAFIPNPNGLPQVNHIDLVKTNNIATNLEWVSALGNYLHAAKGGALSNFLRTISDEDVLKIRAMKGRPLKEVAAAFGCTKGTACRIINGQRRSHPS